MAMWHCPHCGTPQAETARCWVCRRSSTTCSTCRHFRAALSADLGYCALDRRRLPLSGRELRGCWAGRPAGEAPAPVPTVEPHRLRGPATPWSGLDDGSTGRAPARGFVPVELLGAQPSGAGTAGGDGLPRAVPARHRAEPASGFPMGAPDEDWSERTSLFGDADR